MRSYRTKMVEEISLPTRERRERILEEAGYNLFNVPAREVFVDLLTDSGTGAMSQEQWAALMRGDESYAGSRSFERLQDSVEEVMGFTNVVPAHQGRGAENVLYGSLVEQGDVVLNNAHFDTTRAHVANQGADPRDCPVDGARDPAVEGDFKGDFNLDLGRAIVDEVGAENVPVVVQTITNNSTAGQPVSVANTRDVAAFAEEIDATFVLDACRFAENAAFVKRREAEFEGESVADIAYEQLSYADALVMSGKKEGMANIGGFVAVVQNPGGQRADQLFERCKQRAILYEGFPTYGGMAGRDIEAMAVGLREAVTEPYPSERIDTVAAFGDILEAAGMPVFRPVGGHAVYLDAGGLFDIPSEQFPGQALAVELYREGGVRGVELGSFAFPGADRLELVRLALPRRMYSMEHLEHVAEAAEKVVDRKDEVSGYEVVSEPPIKELRHFSAELRPVE
jgi:tryptophanase